MNELLTLIRYQRDRIGSKNRTIAAMWTAVLSLAGALMVETMALVYILY